MISSNRTLQSPRNSSWNCRRNHNHNHNHHRGAAAGNPFSFLMMCCYVWAFSALVVALFVHYQTDNTISNNDLSLALSHSLGRKSSLKHTPPLLHPSSTSSIGGTNEPKKCTIFMAPSSLKGVTSMGIYTARDIRNGEPIMSAPDGPSITLLTDSFRSHTARFPSKKGWLSVWGEYAWGRGHGVPDHVNYEAKFIMDFQITTGALPNHHCLLHSITYGFPNPPYDDSLVDQRRSPGTGAFSYNGGREFFVNRNVEAGEELFLNYGKCRHDTHPSWAEGHPMPVDYHTAVTFMNKLYRNVTSRTTTTATAAATTTAAVEDGSDRLRPPTGMDPLVVKLLPKTWNELKDIMKDNKTEIELIRTLARTTGINQRTPEWLEENGKCLEHMVPGLSQLPHAGHGGMAQHPIRKGDIVVPAPMIQIMDRDLLALYDENGHKVGDQLVLNYCFGHRDSSLLLCPNTNAILINHCSSSSSTTRSHGRCRPNAEVRWSEGWDATSDAWRQMSLQQLSQQPFRGLDMDIVATRDISPGDEVFLDYGPEWEAAWTQHVETWKPLEPILTAKEANEQEQISELLLVDDLRDENPYAHLFTGCQFWETKDDEDKVWDSRDPDWRDSNDDHDKLLKKYARDGSKYVGEYAEHSDLTYWPCVVFRPKVMTTSNAPSNTYTVRILEQPFAKERRPKWLTNDLPRFLTNYPRESIHVFVRRDESDQRKPGVFRHWIGMPDAVFPEHWKNLAV